ncbi:uncharacterized protein LOC121368064 [Gigantopelta aegis]|uniref:uncharacterized protein LOC121368064 n=1 Tax=Gigantopelta aegis TaxID=1735272 RepID=UPI001B888417|nr:uncharacterized protein LOC121368064 [Gigantopelta aegis]
MKVLVFLACLTVASCLPLSEVVDTDLLYRITKDIPHVTIPHVTIPHVSIPHITIPHVTIGKRDIEMRGLFDGLWYKFEPILPSFTLADTVLGKRDIDARFVVIAGDAYRSRFIRKTEDIAMLLL